MIGCYCAWAFIYKNGEWLNIEKEFIIYKIKKQIIIKERGKKYE